MHSSVSTNIGLCGRLEEDELVPMRDLHFRRLVAKCASHVCVCDQNKHIMGTSSSIPELDTSCTDDERRVCVCNFPPIFGVDRFAAGTNYGYYLGRKSK